MFDLFNNNHIRFESLNSTNEFALSLKGMQMFKEGLLITSDFQKKGRGQITNTWHSKSALNILFSVVIEPKNSIHLQFDINKIISLALYDTLSNYLSEVSIKWPNDILVGKKKICGILINNIIFDKKILYSVIGVGLNVNQISFPKFSPPATSLAIELSEKLDLESIRKEVLQNFSLRLSSYRSGNNVTDDYINALFLKGKISDFKTKGNRFKGIIRGVSSRGKLQVEVMRQVREYNLKEVEYVF